LSHLLDTNVISELRKPKSKADKQVRTWVARRSFGDLYLSAITILEIEIGINQVARRDPAQAKLLNDWLSNEVLDIFSGRILPVDVAVARRCAQMHVPNPRPERDALIAATASVHGLTVATRNSKDFVELDVPVVNPWDSFTP